MKINEIIVEANDSYQPPKINKGDEVLVGINTCSSRACRLQLP